MHAAMSDPSTYPRLRARSEQVVEELDGLVVLPVVSKRTMNVRYRKNANHGRPICNLGFLSRK